MNVNDFMEPGERVIKKSGIGGIDLLSDPRGRGDLYLTDRRIVFIPRKSYNFPFLNRLRNEALEISLVDIKSVKLFDRKLRITVENTYTFGFLGADKWIIEINEAKERVTSMMHASQEIIQPAKPEASTIQEKFCPYCGKQLTYIKEYERHYCYSCQRYI